MTKEQKGVVLEALREKIKVSPFFYVLDPTAMTVKETNDLRRKCFDKGIEMQVVKNALAVSVMRDLPAEKNYAPLFDAFKGQTALLFCNTANVPARLLKEISKTKDKPKLKGAYVDSAVFLGEDQLETLTKLKSKEEMLGEVIGLLQSPAKNVISALLSSGQKIAGLVKALEERAA